MSRKLALVIGNGAYSDPSLARLQAPQADVETLAEVLRSPGVGSFDEVTTLADQPTHAVRRAIAGFFAGKSLDDLLLVYFSGHGVLDDRGRLYLATNDTERDLLSGTAIPAAFLTEEMDASRSRRQVLILDCCHSGAFARGAKGTVGGSVGTAEAFRGTGSGRVVLTATDSTQYAWEGDQVRGRSEASTFTRHLVEGLRTGAADGNHDGWITLDELYDYVYEQVLQTTPLQTPGKWSYRQQGDLVIARSPRPVEPPAAELPPEVRQAIEDSRSWVRAAVVEQLSLLVAGPDAGLGRTARTALEQLAQDDSRRVSLAATGALQRAGPARPADAPIQAPPFPAAEVPRPEVRAAASATAPARAEWLPPLVVAAGWILVWFLSLSLASIDITTNIWAGLAVVLGAWFVAGPLVTAALRFAAPRIPPGRAWLIGAGWPLSVVVGLAAPVALRLGYEGVAFMAVGVAAAGLLAALALAPSGLRTPWERLLAVTAGWTAGWLAAGFYFWADALFRIGNEYVSTFAALVQAVPLPALVAGPAASGIVGGALMYLLLRPRPES